MHHSARRRRADEIGWNAARTSRLAQRSHYVITDGGDQPNVVPPDGVGLVLLPRDRLRPNQADVESATTWRRAPRMMTGTTVESRVLGSAWPGHGNRPLAEAMHANIAQVGGCRSGARRISSSRARFSRPWARRERAL